MNYDRTENCGVAIYIYDLKILFLAQSSSLTE